MMPVTVEPPSRYEDIKSSSEEELKQAVVLIGPISVAIDANNATSDVLTIHLATTKAVSHNSPDQRFQTG